MVPFHQLGVLGGEVLKRNDVLLAHDELAIAVYNIHMLRRPVTM